MIKIVKADDIIVQDNLIITIYGDPGMGKTSLGFSASKPLLLDFDNGAQRAIGRKDAVIIKNWNEIKDISAEALIDYNTIVIDTVGRLLESLSLFLIAGNPKFKGYSGELSLQGYGALNVAFKTFLLKIKSFGKDIILISHSKEEKDNEKLLVRLDAMGSSKQEVLKCSDLMGFICAKGTVRTLNFNPTEFTLGKNCAEFPELSIPDYSSNQFFMSEIIQKAKDHMNKKSEGQIKKEKEFNIKLEKINKAVTVHDFNVLVNSEDAAALKHALHSRAVGLGLIFNKELKLYELPKFSDEEPSDKELGAVNVDA